MKKILLMIMVALGLLTACGSKKTTNGETESPRMEALKLVPKGSDAKVPEGYTKVEVPVERTIVMTMLQLSNFTALDAHEVVKGITGTKNLFNKDIKKRVKDGSIFCLRSKD